VTYVWPVYGKICALAQFWKYLYVLVSISRSYIIPGGWWSPVHTRQPAQEQMTDQDILATAKCRPVVF